MSSLKEMAVQRVKRIMSGKLEVPAPGEELLVGAGEIRVTRAHRLLTDVSMRRGVSTKLSCQSSNISSVQSSLR